MSSWNVRSVHPKRPPKPIWTHKNEPYLSSKHGSDHHHLLFTYSNDVQHESKHNVFLLPFVILSSTPFPNLYFAFSLEKDYIRATKF